MLKIRCAEMDEEVYYGNSELSTIDESTLFIPEYIYNEIDRCGVSFKDFIDAVASLSRYGSEFGYCWGDVMKNHEDKPWHHTILSIKSMIAKMKMAIGKEFENIWNINRYMHRRLSLQSTMYEDGFSEIFLHHILDRDVYTFEDINILNCLRTTRHSEFKDTYSVPESSITLVVMKEGFGNHIEKHENKIELIDTLLDVYEVFNKEKALESKLFNCSVKLKMK